MARESRLRRDLPVDIDVDAIWRIAEHIGATHKQFRAAYSRALKRTAATLRKKAVADMKDGLAPRSLDMVRRRLLSFRLDRSSQSKLDNFRLWFGLNAIKVKDLKGRINGRVRPHHTRRDKSTGRFIKARRQAESAGFTPKGACFHRARMKTVNWHAPVGKTGGRWSFAILTPGGPAKRKLIFMSRC